MTLSIALLLLLLVAMVYCFMSEILPVELTAFIGLLVMVFAGWVEVGDAFSGFASPAVITMFSIFFVSAALLETGVADSVGGRIHALVGGREVPLIIILMLVAGVLSAFMNNVAATAVLLPAVASVARRAKLSPGRLFMPLSFGAILGGTTTLVGTPPNILAAEMLTNRGLPSFSLFDFTPLGLALLGVGILFMITVGRRLLPAAVLDKQDESTRKLTHAYRLEERLTSIRIPKGSNLDGQSLRQARLGAALDVKVVVIERGGEKHVGPSPDFVLQGEDLLLVEGRFSRLDELLSVQGLVVQETDPEHLAHTSARVRGITLGLPPGSGLIGRTLSQLRFRERFSVLVVGIRRGDTLLRQELAQEPLQASDQILALGSHEQLLSIQAQKAFTIVGTEVPARELLQERLFLIRVPPGSAFAGTTVGGTKIGELVGLTVIGILRGDQALLAMAVDERIHAGDELLVAGEPTRITDLLALGALELEAASRADLESEDVVVTEAVVAPRAQIAGRTLAALDFRDRYGLQVLALWRQGEPIHRRLAQLALGVGDALLLHGPRERVHRLVKDPDFVVLTHDTMTPRRSAKAPVALGSLALMIGLVVSGLYPIHVAAFTGAVASVLFGALKMEEAYRAIEWKAIFLVAAILPVGLAMEHVGAAAYLAGLVSSVAERFGPYAFLAALAILASLLSQGLDGAPTVVILAPVVLRTAEQLSISPYPLMMCVGLAASAAFMTPFSHKANLLVMSAGGYRAMDYVKVGTPLTIIVLALLVFLVPIFFPIAL